MSVNSTNLGQLAIYHGCMFAGKSRRLILKLSKKFDLGFKVIYVTHQLDQRICQGYRKDVTATTHWSCFSEANLSFPTIATDNLHRVLSELCSYEVIGIDEFQFFQPNDLEVVRELVEDFNKIVYCVGLDADFRRQKFGYLLDLVPLADKVKKLRAKCHQCKVEINRPPFLVPATFTAKISGDLEEIQEPGANQKYVSLCRYHYLRWQQNVLKN